MKKLISFSAMFVVLSAHSVLAASDFYLQIKGTKGDANSQLIKCPAGTCSIASLPADTYAVSVVDAAGKPLSLEKSKYECTVSPRDAASGMASGKRMHKPMVMTKEMSSSQLVTSDTETNLSVVCVSSPASVSVDAATKTTGYDLKKATK